MATSRRTTAPSPPGSPLSLEMDLVSAGVRNIVPTRSPRWINHWHCCRLAASPRYPQPFPICPCTSPHPPNCSLISNAKRRDSSSQPAIKQATIKEEEEQVGDYDEGVEGEFLEDFQDDMLLDDNADFEDDFEEEDANLYVGDGGGGGGISLAGTWWDKKALAIAEEVSMSFDGDLKIYAFKTSAYCAIYLRIEKLSTKYGSPNMTDIEAFSSAFRARLEEAELAGTIPKDISFQVSSPGVERVVRVPEDLERFKDLPMFVKYVDIGTGGAPPQEKDGVFKLVSFDLESCHCTWGVADVKANREKAGKGRPLSKKQREWRLQTPFDSLRLVRRYS